MGWKVAVGRGSSNLIWAETNEAEMWRMYYLKDDHTLIRSQLQFVSGLRH